MATSGSISAHAVAGLWASAPLLEVLGPLTGPAPEHPTPAPPRFIGHDELAAYWPAGLPAAILAASPELHLLRYKRAKRGAVGSPNRRGRRWVHPSHLNGAAHLGDSVGGGTHQGPSGALIVDPRSSEWAVSPTLAPFERVSVGGFQRWWLAGSGACEWPLTEWTDRGQHRPSRNRKDVPRQFFRLVLTAVIDGTRQPVSDPSETFIATPWPNPDWADVSVQDHTEPFAARTRTVTPRTLCRLYIGGVTGAPRRGSSL